MAPSRSGEDAERFLFNVGLAGGIAGTIGFVVAAIHSGYRGGTDARVIQTAVDEQLKEAEDVVRMFKTAKEIIDREVEEAMCPPSPSATAPRTATATTTGSGRPKRRSS